MARLLFFELLKNFRSGLRSIRFLRAYRKAHEMLRDSAVTTDLAAQQIELACQRIGMTHIEACNIIERFFNVAPLARFHHFRRPGLIAFLKAAQARGIRLGILSDYPALAKLEAMAISKYFDTVVNSSDSRVNRLKPDPTGLNLCMAQLGVQPEHTVYVGDRVDVDAECAYRAGVCPIILGSQILRSQDVQYPIILSDGFEELSRMLFRT